VQAKKDAGLKNELRSRLVALKNTRHIKVLKDGINKPAEEQTPDDYEDALDLASPFVRSGLSEGEVDTMIGALE
jgi:hypothetical protein